MRKWKQVSLIQYLICILFVYVYMYLLSVTMFVLFLPEKKKINYLKNEVLNITMNPEF